MTKNVKRSRGTTALLAAMFSIAGISASTSAPANEAGVLANGTSNLVLDAGLHEMLGRGAASASANVASQVPGSVITTMYRPVQVVAIAPLDGEVSEGSPASSAEPVIEGSASAGNVALENSGVSGSAESQSKKDSSVYEDQSGRVDATVMSSTRQADILSSAVEKSSFADAGEKKRVPLVQPVRGMNRQILDRLSQRGEVPRKTRYVYGQGDKQDIVTALQMIVPVGWSAFSSDNGVKNAPLVSWREKGRPWTETLNKVLVQSGMRAMIDWDRKEIDIMVFVPDVDQPLSSNDDVEEKTAAKANAPKVTKPEVHLSAEKNADVRNSGSASAKADRYVEKARDGAQGSGSSRTLKSDDLDLEIARAAEAEIIQAMKRTKRNSSGKLGNVVYSKALKRAVPTVQAAATALPQTSSEVKVAARVEGVVAVAANPIEAEVEKAEIASARAVVADSQANRPSMLSAYAPAGPVVTPKQAAKRYKATQFEGGQVSSLFSVKGSGYNIPLFTALGQVSPAGWFVFSKDPAVTNKLLVAWRGGNRPWLDVLDEILAANNLKARVNFKLNEIQIMASE
jgi:hypothetical protein